MYWLLRWVLNMLILLLISKIVPGIDFASTWSLIITVIVFGFINALIRPIILLLTLPINLLTLGLFTLVINALMFWLTSTIVRGFEIQNFTAAFWGALLYWLFSMLINWFEKGDEDTTIRARQIK